MRSINLLPWRAAARAEEKRRFFRHLLSVFGAALALVLVFRVGLMARIDGQEDRLAVLQAEQARLQAALGALSSLRDERKRLLERLEVIESLQQDRPKTALMLDALARVQVPGAHFQALTYAGSHLTVKGIAENNEDISALMRRLKASPWFSAPMLRGLVEAPEFGPRASRFELSFDHLLPAHPWPGPEAGLTLQASGQEGA